LVIEKGKVSDLERPGIFLVSKSHGRLEEKLKGFLWKVNI